MPRFLRTDDACRFSSAARDTTALLTACGLCRCFSKCHRARAKAASSEGTSREQAAVTCLPHTDLLLLQLYFLHRWCLFSRTTFIALYREGRHPAYVIHQRAPAQVQVGTGGDEQSRDEV